MLLPQAVLIETHPDRDETYRAADMAIWKMLRSVKDITEALPEMVADAQAIQVSGNEPPPPPPVAVSPPPAGSSLDSDEPIGGLSLERYASTARAVHGQGEAEALAGAGLAAGAWRAAAGGWNQRLVGNIGLCARFNAAYRGAV